MDKYQKAIYEYERSRQHAVEVEEKRLNLLSGCTNTESPSCLHVAYEETREMRTENNEYYEFSEVLEENHAEGTCCDNCLEAYRMKSGELATARKAFGESKRRLSFLGKGLIEL